MKKWDPRKAPWPPGKDVRLFHSGGRIFVILREGATMPPPLAKRIWCYAVRRYAGVRIHLN